MENQEVEEAVKKYTSKSMDWHLFWTAAGVVVALSAVIIGCYVSISTRLTRIETVLIIKNMMPSDLVVTHKDK